MRRTFLVLVAACGLVLSACGDTGHDVTTTLDPGSDTTSSSVTSTTAAPTTTTSGVTTTSSDATTTSVPTTTTETTTTTTAAPVPIDGPIPGSAWVVVGVDHDDVLNVRAAPGVGAMIVAELEPTADGIEVTGEAMQVGSVIWWEVSTPAEGWVSSRYLAVAGATDDITSSIVDANSGTRPIGETMADLADMVLALSPADETVVVVPESVSGDFGEITIDAFDVGDDAIRGRRLHIFGQRDGDSGFSLYAVEATSLCWRAADGTGLCV